MKKITAILVCLLLVASLAVTAFAADEVKYTLTADKTSASRGDIVTYTIATNGIDNCKGVAMIIDYDKTVFEYVENSGTNNAPAGSFGFVQISNNMLACSMTNPFATFSISGEMFTLKLKVLDAAAFGDSQVTIADAAYTAADKSVIEVEGNSVKMSVVCAEHKWDAGKQTTAPTCEAEGVTTFTCENGCGKTKTEAIDKLAHTLGEFTETKAPTCSAEGEKTAVCSVCKETVVEAIAKLAHTWGEWKETTAPTTKKEGVETRTCTVCAAEETRSIPKIENSDTSDNTMIIPFVLLMVLSAAGVALTVIGKKRVA